ncbi:UNVERIFIED_CONTAM: hypothetical protein Sradi_6750900 [Sesamum radiatum]|uniref:Uncharacterized protein n=1 Tax=Sesamum radiatum TaxID=300843 RepID=A0AAW2JSB2_SESRA
MQASHEDKLSPDHSLDSEADISQDFNKLKIAGDLEDGDEKVEEYGAMDHHGDDDEEEEEEEEEDEDGEEFSFMFVGENTLQIAAEDAFVNGQIKTVFPLFNQDLLFSGNDSNSLHENLPMTPPVKKVFVEMNEEDGKMKPSTPENDGIMGPYCEWRGKKAVEASPESCKKSNSTGFSKIWRFKDFVGRCNSDGRDAFFLKQQWPGAAAADRAAGGRTAEEKSGKKDDSTVKIVRKVKKSGKNKTASLSAHEVYLRSKAKEEERRRSYLPYRPELMGFFTNVNGGLTKNVHPY